MAACSLPAITAACYALNPNLLYLGSIPMTEVVFFAAFSILLFSLFRFRRTQNRWLIILGGAASITASLTRYDGWFLIPFFAVGFFWFARERRVQAGVLFRCIASLAPLYWLAHNYWETSDFFSFYRGPYSAKAIYQRALDAGLARYRGDHQWGYSVLYYGSAGPLCTGWALVLLGAAGAFCAFWKRYFIALLFLLLTPLFYVWSMYSSGTPIFVPFLFPHGYYNTRYGIAVLPLAAFRGWRDCAGAPCSMAQGCAVNPTLGGSTVDDPAFARALDLLERIAGEFELPAHLDGGQAAQFLDANYRRGDGILMTFGDLTAILSHARIPLSEAVHEGSGPAWLATVSRLDLIHRPKWAIAQATDRDTVLKAIDKANWKNTLYQPVLEIDTLKDPVVRIYRRVE